MRFLKLIPLLIFFLFGVPFAYADSISLGVYPPIIRIDALAPADINASISVENQGNTLINLTPELRPFKPSDEEDGKVSFTNEKDANFKDPSLFEKVKLFDKSGSEVDSIDLSPKQKKDFILNIKLPSDEPPADYYFSVVFIASAENQTSINSSQASAGISSNILLSIGPKGKTVGEILEFSSPFLLDKGPVPFTLRVKNTNSFFINTMGDILIKNIFGQSVGRVDLPKTTILAKSVRDIGNKWVDSFPGFYEAKLTLSLSDTGPVFVRNIFFFIFPISYLLYFSLGFLILIYLLIRVRKKLQES